MSIIAQPLLYFEDITNEGTLAFQLCTLWPCEQVKTNHEVNHEIQKLMSKSFKAGYVLHIQRLRQRPPKWQAEARQ